MIAGTVRAAFLAPRFTCAEGHGAQDEGDPALSAHDRVAGYTLRVRLDIVLDSGAVQELREALYRRVGVTGASVQLEHGGRPIVNGGPGTSPWAEVRTD